MKGLFLFSLFCLSMGFVACDGNDDFVFPEPIYHKPITLDTIPAWHAVYDTIKPFDYFPAFPGSYWVYNNGDTLRVEDNYKLCIYNDAYYLYPPNFDTVYLPKFLPNSIYGDVFIKGYLITNHGGYKDPPFRFILSETVGASFYVASLVSSKVEGMTIKKDTSIIVNGITYNNVIITIQYDTHFSMYYPPMECAGVKEYYAKGIGLIRREVRSFPFDSIFSVDCELVDYNISTER